MKMKLCIFLLFVFLVNVSVFSVDVIEKQAIIEGSNACNANSGAYWNMLSFFQNKTVIYINQKYSIDTGTLEFVHYFTPPDQFWFALRPPYSNNMMPYIANVPMDLKTMQVNIETNEHTSIEDIYSYNEFWLGSDRRYNSDMVHTPEYSVTVESGWLFWYVDKDHKRSDEDAFFNGDNSKIESLLLSEFKGTIFDTPYWMNTFTNLLSSLNIITKYKLSFKSTEFSKNNEDYTQDYLMEKIESYFNIDVDLFYSLYKLNIYANGFYAYDTEKIIVYDIINNSVASYNIQDCSVPSNYTYYPWEVFNTFEILMYQNYFFILYIEDRETFKVYKLST